jgi:hypothetical protein
VPEFNTSSTTKPLLAYSSFDKDVNGSGCCLLNYLQSETLMLEITSKLAAIFCKYKTVSCNSCNDNLLLVKGFVDLIGICLWYVHFLDWSKLYSCSWFLFCLFEAAISNS